MEFKTIIEPFRIKTVEPIRQTSRAEREHAIRVAHYNPFQIRAEDVLIDLLTDSGTGAMSIYQWAGMMRGDESYAGARSFFAFEQTVHEITGFKHVIPTHQGRAAEHILSQAMVDEGVIVPNNTHFDTTRANIEARRGVALNLPIAEGHQPATLHPFKGNMDLAALERTLREKRGQIPMVMCTVTNNSEGGQPVSMANVRGVSELCKQFGVPFIIDACRFAENAMFIKMREPGYEDKTPMQIAQEMFRLADGCTMSAKKDGMANIGGFLAVNDDALAERCRNSLILTEGFPTYGGLAGYDLEAIAVGLREALSEDYLRYRIRTVEYLSERMTAAGIPTVRPAGGHALYLDAKSWLSHIPQSEYPGWALSVALYTVGGIRACEIGSVMFGKQPDATEKFSELELVRLAFPRRVYTQSHMDYVCEVLIYLHSVKHNIRGVKIVQQPSALRHFTAKFAPVAESVLAV
ncbi:MAG: tryptophanase [Gemmatimonadetes bacterium]|nr:tryptophanase [Gemmatimonadota bacterium]